MSCPIVFLTLFAAISDLLTFGAFQQPFADGLAEIAHLIQDHELAEQWLWPPEVGVVVHHLI